MKKEHSEYYKILGENVAFYRRRLRITQEKLAEMAGVNNVHISHIENGGRGASLDSVFAIAKALGVEPYKLFQNKE